MENQTVIERVKDLTGPLFKEKGLELVDIAYAQEGSRMILRVLVDKTGGVTLDECALINNELGEALDKEDTIFSSYILEVSSPGLDRPLVAKEDFERVVDKKMQVFLKNPVGGKTCHSGTLQSVDEISIALDTKTGLVNIPFDAISRGKVEIELKKRKEKGESR